MGEHEAGVRVRAQNRVVLVRAVTFREGVRSILFMSVIVVQIVLHLGLPFAAGVEGKQEKQKRPTEHPRRFVV
jgi:hypothetical protein